MTYYKVKEKKKSFIKTGKQVKLSASGERGGGGRENRKKPMLGKQAETRYQGKKENFTGAFSVEEERTTGLERRKRRADHRKPVRRANRENGTRKRKERVGERILAKRG